MVDVPTAAIVIIAIAAIVVPLAFVGVVVIAAIARRGGAVLGPTTVRGIAFLGGLALGSMFLVAAGDLEVGLPFPAVAAVLAVNEWRAGRRASGGWLIAGMALPWTLLWTAFLALLATGTDLDVAEVVRNFAAGALPLAAGLVVAGRYGGDAPAGARMGAPPSRSFGVVARALREPSQVGPFRMPELAAVVAWALVGLATAFLPIGSPLVRFMLGAIIGSALASEAYLRAMAPQARLAMEAFSWLGEQDLASLRRLTGEPVPLSSRAATAWLARHPAATDEPPAIRSLRIQALLLAGRTEEASAVARDRSAAATPEDRFEQAADRQLLAWWTAAPEAHDGLAALEADAAAIQPHDGDAHLRAAVSVATARVRDRAVTAGANPLEVIEPLVAMRERLGRRADGLLRRVLWRRLFAVFLTASLAVGIVGELTGLVPWS